MTTDQALRLALQTYRHDPEKLRERLAQILAAAWEVRMNPQAPAATA